MRPEGTSSPEGRAEMLGILRARAAKACEPPKRPESHTLYDSRRNAVSRYRVPHCPTIEVAPLLIYGLLEDAGLLDSPRWAALAADLEDCGAFDPPARFPAEQILLLTMAAESKLRWSGLGASIRPKPTLPKPTLPTPKEIATHPLPIIGVDYGKWPSDSAFSTFESTDGRNIRIDGLKVDAVITDDPLELTAPKPKPRFPALSGSDLDLHASLAGVKRVLDETDADFRARLLEYIRRPMAKAAEDGRIKGWFGAMVEREMEAVQKSFSADPKPWQKRISCKVARHLRQGRIRSERQRGFDLRGRGSAQIIQGEEAWTVRPEDAALIFAEARCLGVRAYELLSELKIEPDIPF